HRSIPKHHLKNQHQRKARNGQPRRRGSARVCGSLNTSLPPQNASCKRSGPNWTPSGANLSRTRNADMPWVLDASAMMAFLRQERGADLVIDALTEPGDRCYAHYVNLCEL